MAPLERPRKKGNRRLDAALDAMAAMGFSEKLVSETVDELLKVYGDEGWIFIEETSYLLLINVLLQKQNDNSGQKDTSLRDGERDREDTETSVAGTSATNESLDSVSLTVKECLPIGEAERGMRNMDLNSGKRNVDFIAGRIVKDSGSAKYHRNILGGSQQLVDGVSTGTRRPCYGWLSEDEEDDHVEPLPQCSEKLLVGRNRKRKRKTRWDERPEVIFTSYNSERNAQKNSVY
ncbi:uncharacterized protein LOC112490410 isoform X2 [Ziziphus jujuba]|uniref:Uncharacterized protein LOC112490410 isoform X2 n=1 Tax=Ziziphus jujuba TaxID=326968 RepID=A0ABM4AFY6_ZIZJJ|nr:uncharacterized protein LOC112490410 isoform X2 [Ziziphus jujuba]